MDPSKDKATLERAKKMLIAGDSYDSIMDGCCILNKK